ncbi:hypothetical protein [uncultured Clostridium sp.]|uniref:hypothetical protein n=1 Tax=uncultured Clostridium sp. TaxID=59620 RepID=UPI0025E95DAA|nr:hypothetical protein [uncultured Clostridium sp.]
MKINLKDVIEAIEYENDVLHHYYNKNTGVIIYQDNSQESSYNAHDISNIEKFEEWEQELIKDLYHLKTNPQDYIRLPENGEKHELKMMIDFCDSFSDIYIDKKISNDDNTAADIHSIKKVIQEKGLINDWYDYREAVERDIAAEWCRDNKIDYIE